MGGWLSKKWGGGLVFNQNVTMNGVRYRVKLERNFGKIGVYTPCTPPPLQLGSLV